MKQYLTAVTINKKTTNNTSNTCNVCNTETIIEHILWYHHTNTTWDRSILSVCKIPYQHRFGFSPNEAPEKNNVLHSGHSWLMLV